jgi:phosphatidylglycerol:prolipoprotein diacylglycerol transferase
MIALFPTRTVALQIAGFSVHWYGIMYVLAFIIAAVLLPILQKERGLKFSREQWLDIVSWGVLGVLLGGRLGFVFFYEPSYFIAAPWKIIAVWEGGMSSHGGFLGVGIALLLLCWKKKYDLLAILDVVVVPAAIGLALGRLGNFINQELYGTVTTLPWSIAIPGVSGLRHPTQFYELCTDLLVALCCFLSLPRPLFRFSYGRTFALFLMLYAIARFCIEYFREQQYALFILGPLCLTRGQLLTIPLLLFGVAIWFLPVRWRAYSQ